LLAAVLLRISCAAAGADPLRVEFAGAAEGRRELTKVDEFVKARIGKVIDSLRPKLEAVGVSWPEKVWLVRTSGAEEGGAPYTRGTAIVLPDRYDRYASRSAGALTGLLAHEFFHILSRHHPELKDALYSIIGFKPCAEPQLSADLAKRRITNPDAPRNVHAIELEAGGAKERLVPVLLARSAKYDAAAGREFFEAMETYFVPADAGREITASDLISVDDVGGFAEQTGGHAGNLNHPEEIMADNFMLLLTGGKRAGNPEILGRLRDVLEKAQHRTEK